MIDGLLWMAAANAGVLLAAGAATRRLSTGRAEADAALFVFLRLVFIMASVLGTGLAGLLRPHALGLLWLAVGAVLVARGEHRRLRVRLPSPDASRALRVLALLVVARSLLQVWFFFPFVSDALSYHLPKVAEWVRDGAIGTRVGPDPRGWFPAGFELAEAWWCVFLRHDVLIEAAGLEFHLLGVLSVHALARGLGASARTSFFAGLALALVPGLSVQAVGCLNDGPIAALYAFTAAMVLARARAGFLLAVAAVGAGVKPTYAYLAPGLLLLAWMHRESLRSSPMSARGAAAMLVLCLPLGGYWYARNAAVHGNPLHPIGGGSVEAVSGKELQRVGPSLASFRKNAYDLWGDRVQDHRRAYHPLLEHVAGWGPVVFACGLPALAAAAVRSPGFLRLAAAYGVSLATMLALVLPDPYTGRFVLFFAALPLVALALVLDRVRLLALPASASAFAAFAMTLMPWGMEAPVLARSVLVDGWRERWMGHVLELDLPQGKTACLSGQTYDGQSYVLYGPDFGREVAHVESSTADVMLGNLVATGARTMFVMNLDPQWPAAKPIFELIRDKRLRVRDGYLVWVP